MKKAILIPLAALLMLLAACGAAPEQEESGVPQTLREEPAEKPAEELAEDIPEELPEAAEQAFTSMELKIEKGTLYIRSGKDFSLTRRGGEAADYEIDGGTLYVKTSYTGDTVLTLPEDGSYEVLRLTVDSGHAYAEGPLSLQTLELKQTRGKATLEALEVSQGSVIEVEQGSAFVSGDLGTSIDASCREGHLTLELSHAKDAYNCQLDVSEGNLSLGGETFHGRSVARTIDNGGDRTLTLTGRRGDISVKFEK